MLTKINLEYPYNLKWKCGYLNINKEGRKIIHLYNNDKERSTTSYARYLLSVHLGRFLENHETVDHIDGDKTNDDLSNLQILTMEENIKKTHKKADVILKCPVCKKIFTRTRTQLRGKLEKAKQNKICCSRHCGGKYSHKKN